MVYTSVWVNGDIKHAEHFESMRGVKELLEVQEVDCYTGKPIKIMVYCFYKEKFDS